MTDEEKEALAETCQRAMALVMTCRLSDWSLEESLDALVMAYIAVHQEQLGDNSNGINPKHRMKAIESITATMHKCFAVGTNKRKRSLMRYIDDTPETQVGLGPQQVQTELNYGPRCRAVTAVLKERARQDELKNQGCFPWTCADTSVEELHQYHTLPLRREITPPEKLAVLAEEFGEVSRVVAQSLADQAPVDNSQLKTELTQVAAVALAWLEALDEN